jgi:hypothetical protein
MPAARAFNWRRWLTKTYHELVLQGDRNKTEQLQEAFFYFDEERTGSISLVRAAFLLSPSQATNMTHLSLHQDKLREIVQRSGEAMGYQDVRPPFILFYLSVYFVLCCMHSRHICIFFVFLC